MLSKWHKGHLRLCFLKNKSFYDGGKILISHQDTSFIWDQVDDHEVNLWHLLVGLFPLFKWQKFILKSQQLVFCTCEVVNLHLGNLLCFTFHSVSFYYQFLVLLEMLFTVRVKLHNCVHCRCDLPVENSLFNATTLVYCYTFQMLFGNIESFSPAFLLSYSCVKPALINVMLKCVAVNMLRINLKNEKLCI